MKFKNDMGRSMMEMILYLGLIVVLTASTLKMYADSVEKTRVIKLETQIDDLKEYVNTYFLGRSLPASDWTSFRNAVGEDKFVNPWGGKVVIAKSKSTVTTKEAFELKYSGPAMDTKRCISIGNALIGKGALSVRINSTELKDLNLTVSSVAENCDSMNSSGNSIEGIFQKE